MNASQQPFAGAEPDVADLVNSRCPDRDFAAQTPAFRTVEDFNAKFGAAEQEGQ